MITCYENFFGLLKQDLLWRCYSYDELKSEIERYIKYYNGTKNQRKIRWLSPVQYSEAAHEKRTKTASLVVTVYNQLQTLYPD